MKRCSFLKILNSKLIEQRRRVEENSHLFFEISQKNRRTTFNHREEVD
jgi:hypothetical protein